MIATVKLTKAEIDEAIKLYMQNRGFKMHDNAAIRVLTRTEYDQRDSGSWQVFDGIEVTIVV